MMDNSCHVTVTTMQNKQSVIQVFTFVIPYGSDSSAPLKSRISCFATEDVLALATPDSPASAPLLIL